MTIKLAFRNLIGAGLRTWLNVAVLSFSFVVIIFYNGIIDGWNRQARTDTIEWEIGGGQLWHPDYDPYDVFTFQDAHAPLSEDLKKRAQEQKVVPVLVTQATVYPEGRMQSVILKGIDPDQSLLKLPGTALNDTNSAIPALIGNRMAESIHVKQNDILLIRWRDTNGTFDAREIRIVDIFHCNVPGIDNGQIWLPLHTLQDMLGMPGEATYIVVGEKYQQAQHAPWILRDRDYLLADLDKIIQSKKGGASILYGLLLVIALLAIFDTQVLSIFRRQKEIGTYIALGMTRWQVIRIFTVEGTTYSILAMLLAAVYGTPLFVYLAKNGFALPLSTTDMGISIAEKIYPVYGTGLIISTVVLVVVSATIVSFLPARRISKMNPTDALKGKIQ